eukprot:jgi/Antlo1/595/2340
MASQPLGEQRIYNCFRRWSYCHRTFKLGISTKSDPGKLRCKILEMRLFFFQCSFCDKHGKVVLLYAQHFYFRREVLLYLLPDKHCLRLHNEASLDVVIVVHISSQEHLAVPLWKILLLLCRYSEPLLFVHCKGLQATLICTKHPLPKQIVQTSVRDKLSRHQCRLSYITSTIKMGEFDGNNRKRPFINAGPTKSLNEIFSCSGRYPRHLTSVQGLLTVLRHR